jgi:3-phosphoglycerate kinase
MDIGPETVALFKDKMASARLVVWNGPLGVTEIAPFARGTGDVAKALTELSAVTIVGGAFLNFLAGKELPGIAALADR